MIEDHYEINVSRKEKKIYDMEERHYHFCKIEIRNKNEENAMEKFKRICENLKRQNINAH